MVEARSVHHRMEQRLEAEGGEPRAASREQMAKARGYITEADYAAIDVPLDRVRAMLWKLTH